MSNFDYDLADSAEDKAFPKLTKKFSFRSSDINDDNFLPLRKTESFSAVRAPTQFSNFRAESFGDSPLTAFSDPLLPFKFTKGSPNKDEAVIVVDTFSTGAYLAHVLFHAGYSVICVLSGDLKHLLDMVGKNLSYTFAATHVFNPEEPLDSFIDRIVSSVELPITAVFPGAETGVILADMISERMGLRTNGTRLSEARRDKVSDIFPHFFLKRIIMHDKIYSS
jgi:hypothetical protein